MLLVVTVYVVAVGLLCTGFYYARLTETLKRVGVAAGTAFAAMRNDSLDDLEKEKAVQRCAIAMVRQTVLLITKLVVVLLVTALPVWLVSVVGWMEVESFWRFTLRADVLLITTAVLLVSLFVYRFLGKPRSE